jgi:hypothetical protein
LVFILTSAAACTVIAGLDSHGSNDAPDGGAADTGTGTGGDTGPTDAGTTSACRGDAAHAFCDDFDTAFMPWVRTSPAAGATIQPTADALSPPKALSFGIGAVEDGVDAYYTRLSTASDRIRLEFAMKIVRFGTMGASTKITFAKIETETRWVTIGLREEVLSLSQNNRLTDGGYGTFTEMNLAARPPSNQFVHYALDIDESFAKVSVFVDGALISQQPLATKLRDATTTTAVIGYVLARSLSGAELVFDNVTVDFHD